MKLLIACLILITLTGCAVKEEHPKPFIPTEEEMKMWGCEELKKRDKDALC